MKKLLIFTLVALLSIFFIDRSYSKQNQAELQQMLISKIEEQQLVNNEIKVNFEELFDFKWDKVYVFTPYTSIKEVNNQLGFTWLGAKSTGIDRRDDVNLIVFVENNQVAQYIELPRSYGDIVAKGEEAFEINGS
ncbi:hypothetical protein [Metabacillus iocasae]|uniref:Uncharacterized protein n=1 Tax=Priestia iocasae TaxID=2291674 RepID=A0ABS2QXR2_9BACI|nr:hypothetical protein [Metabacillus iocasae]MBM7703792.1 hypothetical protein [Metabacillus iocasae]